MRAYQRVLPEIHSLGGELVAVSAQTPDGSLSTKEQNELAFRVLSDVGNDVARMYGLVFSLDPELVERYRELGLDLAAVNGDERWELPMPGTFVIGRDGGVRLSHVDPDYTTRLEPAEILAALRALRAR